MKYLDYSKLAAFRARHFAELNDAQHDYIDVVRFFGPGRVDPAAIKIEYEKRSFRLTDSLIEQYAAEMADTMRAEGRIYNGPPAMKLVSSHLTESEPSLVVQPTDYALQAGTCFALDHTHPEFEPYGGTLRDYYRRDCRTPAVENNPLAICLGVCGLLLVEENDQRFRLQITRSRQLASLEGTIGPSVAGVVDFTTDHENLRDLNAAALGDEVEEELNLCADEYEIVPLAFAIELFRGERPQLFSLIRTSLNRERVSRRLESVPVGRREFEGFDLVPLNRSGSLARRDTDALNIEARMSCRLTGEFLAT